MKRTLAAVAAALALPAFASGDYGPSYTMFKAYRSPDIPLARFQAGDLGVLQPGMRRAYLYAGWRALTLGPAVRKRPGTDKGLARADGSVFGYGWEKGGDEAGADAQGDGALVPRVAAALHVPVDAPEPRTVLACPPASVDQAHRTLRQLLARPDANRERVNAWLVAQYQVGQACAAADEARYQFPRKPLTIAPPAPLAQSEPVYWRQLREYQRAAWAFQAERYADSTAAFERIGATAGHPMQGLGAYLALRSEVRRLAAAAKDVALDQRDQQARALERRGAGILVDAALAPMHEPTRALLRAMRVVLTPEIRLDELSRYLDDANADPYALDRLGDWSVLMDRAEPPQMQAQRAQHDFVDWIETLRACDAEPGGHDCGSEQAHAIERWNRTHARPWLVAALMLGGEAPAPLLQAGKAVTADDPAYVTVRYHLARLYRLAGRRDDARAVADEALRLPLSPGARNLLREERFAVATSVQDAAAYLLRTNVDMARGEDDPHEDMLNDDVLAWFKFGLPLNGMVELARVQALPQALRARVAGAAWIRAALLDRQDAGNEAAALLAQLAPDTAAMAARYRAATSSAERRHVALVAAMTFGLSAELSMMSSPVTRAEEDDAVAAAWCAFKRTAADQAPDRFVWRLPAPPQLGDPAALRDELARLAPLKTATGVTGDDVLQWADTHPQDAELPWLLHAVVLSTRGGCLDPDTKALSKKAFGVLHKRYPDSPWTGKTPYYY